MRLHKGAPAIEAELVTFGSFFVTDGDASSRMKEVFFNYRAGIYF
jgi:hypothetical protein